MHRTDAPQRRAERRQMAAAGQAPYDHDEQEHVQQVREQHCPEVRLGSEAEESEEEVEDRVAREIEMPALRAHQVFGQRLVLNGEEIEEVVGIEVRPDYRVVDERCEYQRSEQQEPLAGGGAE